MNIFYVHKRSVCFAVLLVSAMIFLRAAAASEVSHFMLFQEDRGDSMVQQELACGSSLHVAEAASDSSIRNTVLQIRAVVKNRLERVNSLFYFNSLFAVLFKIAMIPSLLFIFSVDAAKVFCPIRRRILQFVHGVDGKKGRSSLFHLIETL